MEITTEVGTDGDIYEVPDKKEPYVFAKGWVSEIDENEQRREVKESAGDKRKDSKGSRKGDGYVPFRDA